MQAICLELVGRIKNLVGWEMRLGIEHIKAETDLFGYSFSTPVYPIKGQFSLGALGNVDVIRRIFPGAILFFHNPLELAEVRRTAFHAMNENEEMDHLGVCCEKRAASCPCI